MGSGTVAIEPTITLNLVGARYKDTALLEEGTNYLMVYNSADGTGTYKWKTLDDSIADVTWDDSNSLVGHITAVREGETRVLAENKITGQIVFTRVIVTDGVTYPQLVLGRDTTTALKKNGTVWAWGDNTFREIDYRKTVTDEFGYVENNPNYGEYIGITYGTGKLGVGSDQSLITTPTRLTSYYDEPNGTLIPEFKGITKISAGDSHMLAVDTQGTVYAWGDNTYGQLGCSPNALRNSKYPVRVRILDNNGNSVTNIISVAAGSNHSLALTNTGEVYAWGRNDDGQLGRGTVTAYPVYPNSFDDLSVVNSYYDLIASAVIYGNGKGLPDYTPTRMNGFRDLQLSGVLDMAATVSATGVLLVDGTIWTVGSNEYGQLGAGYMYSEGVTLGGEGALYDEDENQINLGMTGELVQVAVSADAMDAAGRPVASEPIVGINRIMGRGYNFSIITEGKHAYIWGDNSSEQLGAGIWLQRSELYDDMGQIVHGQFTDEPDMAQHDYAISPVKLQSADINGGGALEDIIEVSLGGYVGGTVQGLAVTMEVEYDYSGGQATVSERTYTTYAWGANDYAKAGFTNSADTTRATAFDVFAEREGADHEGLERDKDSAPIKSMSAGGNHSAGYDENGIVYMWGNNEYGQLGNFRYATHRYLTTGEKDENGEDIYVKDENGDPILENDPSKYTEGTAEYERVKSAYQSEVSRAYPTLVDEEHIAMFRVTENERDGIKSETHTEDYRYQVKIGEKAEEQTKIIGKYMYSFSVDKEVDEVKTLQLKYKVLDDSVASLGNIYTQKEGAQEAGTRVKEISYSNDALHQKTETYLPVILKEPTDQNTFGTTRVMAMYEGVNSKGEDMSKTGVAIVNTLGKDEAEMNGDGELVVTKPFRTLPQVAAGDEFTLALNIKGELLSWGRNDMGQLGTGSTSSHNINPNINGNIATQLNSHYGDGQEHYLVKIAAGARHALALDDMGAVWVWGDNAYGQLGIGNTGGLVRIPEVPEALDPKKNGGNRIVDIYALDTSSYAIDMQGTLYAWGAGENFMSKDTLPGGKVDDSPNARQDYGNVPARISLLARTLEVGEGYILKGSGTVWQLPKNIGSPDVERLRDDSEADARPTRTLWRFPATLTSTLPWTLQPRKRRSTRAPTCWPWTRTASCGAWATTSMVRPANTAAAPLRQRPAPARPLRR